MSDLPNDPENPSPAAQETLSLQDLLIDAESNALSDYLALSLSRDGIDARISISTTDAEPTTYTSVFSGVHEIDLQTLLATLQADSSQG